MLNKVILGNGQIVEDEAFGICSYCGSELNSEFYESEKESCPSCGRSLLGISKTPLTCIFWTDEKVFYALFDQSQIISIDKDQGLNTLEDLIHLMRIDRAYDLLSFYEIDEGAAPERLVEKVKQELFFEHL